MNPLRVSRTAIARDLKDLIRSKSVCSDSNLGAANLVARFLRRSGFRVVVQKTRENGKIFANVIGVKGRGEGALLLCSHLDTVPPGDHALWTQTGGNPWNATLKGSTVYGLGSADDKGPMTAMIHAGARWKSAELKRPLVVMGTFGEEHGMGGARLFVRSWKGPRPAYAFVGEPTSLALTYRHKGMGVLTITLHSKLTARAGAGKTQKFKGKQAHSSRPWTGVNALVKAAASVRLLARKNPSLLLTRLSGGFAANLIPGSAELGVARGGSGRSVPVFPALAVLAVIGAVGEEVKKLGRAKDRAIDPPIVTSNFGVAETRGETLSMTFDFRLLPGQSIRPVHRSLARRLPALLRSIPGIRATLSVERDNPPLGTPAAHPIVKLGRAAQRSEGLPELITTKPSCTEAGIYSDWGVPAVIFGPGHAAGNIHAPNERVELSQIEKAIRFYDSLIGRVCAGAGR